MNISAKTAINLWLGLGVVLIVVMIVIGGITRLTGSGLSIVEWKIISGAIPPLSESEWQITFEKYKQFPQYQKLNHGMNLQAFKSIFWWEYIHRLMGRVIGVIFIFPFIIFFMKKVLPGWLIRRLSIIFLLGFLQAFVGWFMVKSGLVNVPHVSHFRLALHLSMALLLIGIMLWTMLDYNNKDFTSKNKFREVTQFPIYCLFLLIIQIVLGAFVAGLKAGLYYNTYPLMGGKLFPDQLFSSVSNIFQNGVTIQFIHRWFAWVVLAAIIILIIKIRRGDYTRKVKSYSNALVILLIVQIIFGIATLILHVPVFLAVLHQLIAVLLFGILMIMIYYLRYENSKGHLEGRII